VLVPALVDRQDTWSGNPQLGRMTNQPHREFIYRMSYEMGRHIIGYEVQKVLAAVDVFANDKEQTPLGVLGYGEGGLLALYSGALDPRIQAVGVSGYFGQRENVWREPIYRNVWGLLKEFGDAEMAALIAPRALIIEDVPGPRIDGPPAPRAGRGGAAPGGTIYRFEQGSGAVQEVQRAQQLAFGPLKVKEQLRLVQPDKQGKAGSRPWVQAFLSGLLHRDMELAGPGATPRDQRKQFDPLPRQKRQFLQAVRYTQNLLPTAVDRRDQFWNKMDTSSLDKWQQSTESYRDYFHDEIIGKLPKSSKPLNPRTRLIYDTPKWKGYEVVLDLYDEVICYGILLVPNDIKPGEKRPVVVCQHGLEGRPQDVCPPDKKTPYYNSFGAQLADRGYVVFAPQNPYIFGDRFRVLNRKGNPLKLSLYSFIVRQHERILDFLETLPFVDAQRIAYYGLSYGGKVAMRIPALIGRYCAVICSGDFNEWIWKNINLIWRSSYMFSGEYEMYEFDLGNTFNYAEMARLIAPRPFMVERGHDDGVGLDEWVAHEFARVRYLYARLKIPERTEIEFFPGGHEIHSQGTFRFLARNLNWK
jgi:cephalosporin-C deacetylase-like acetyl esterase